MSWAWLLRLAEIEIWFGPPAQNNNYGSWELHVWVWIDEWGEYMKSLNCTWPEDDELGTKIVSFWRGNLQNELKGLYTKLV